MCTVAVEVETPSAKPKVVHCGLLESASLSRQDKKGTAKPVSVKPEDLKAVASAVAACKLGLVDQLVSILDSGSNIVDATDIEGRTCLHYAAGYGHEECVDTLLSHGASVSIRDGNGDAPLHFAAVHGHPMCAYTLAKAEPETCLVRNIRGQNPIEVAAACERREVLNAMLLSCAGDSGAVAVQAMKVLLVEGAVPDTWAPNGSSALMLAASANGTEALTVLLDNGASIELQDALGRSALMFAAGNNAAGALNTLLDAGACIAARDRRGRSALEYAPEGSDAKQLLQSRLQALEDVAAKLQEDLLASLDSKSAPKVAATASKSKSKRKRSKASKKAKAESLAKTKDGCTSDAKAAEDTTAEEDDADGCAADVETEADILAIALQPDTLTGAEASETDSGGNPETPVAGAVVTPLTAVEKANVDEGSQIEDDSDDWQVVCKSQRSSSSKPQPEAPVATAPPTTTSVPKKREPTSLPFGQKLPMAAPPKPVRATGIASASPAATASNTSTDPAPTSVPNSLPIPEHHSTPRAAHSSSKPPVPSSAPRSELTTRFSLAAALKLPSVSTAQQRDPAWPSKPQGTPLGFKAALLGQSSLLGHSSSPYSTTSSAFGSELTCSEQQASEREGSDMDLAGPTPAEAAAAEQVNASSNQEQQKVIPENVETAEVANSESAVAEATNSVGTQTALESEVEALRRQVASLQQSQQYLRRELQLQDFKHQQELSAVLEDAAQHKLEAMALAAQNERTRISVQLQLLGFSSDLLRALLHPASVDLLSLIDAPHAALPMHTTSTPWSTPLFDPSSITASKWDNLSFPASTPVSITPSTISPPLPNTSPYGSYESSPIPLPDLNCSITHASRNTSGSSFAGLGDTGSSYVSSAMSPLSTGSPSFSMRGGTGCSSSSLFFNALNIREPKPVGELPNLPESLDDDFTARLTSIMERADRFAPFGCSKQLHSFVDPIKDTPLPESALISNH